MAYYGSHVGDDMYNLTRGLSDFVARDKTVHYYEYTEFTGWLLVLVLLGLGLVCVYAVFLVVTGQVEEEDESTLQE